MNRQRLTHQASQVFQIRARFAVSLLSACLIVSACGRSGASAPAPLNTNNPLAGNTNNQTSPSSSLPNINTNSNTNSGTVTGGNTTGTGTGAGTGTGGSTTGPTPFACTLAPANASVMPLATQPPDSPKLIDYLLTVSPAVTAVPQPTITGILASTSSQVNRFVVAQMTPNASTVTIRGNFNYPGSITLSAGVNINGQNVQCSLVVNVTQAVPKLKVVYRYDRSNPPDIFYTAVPVGSQPGPQSAPPNYDPRGPMFDIYEAAPSKLICDPVPLFQCVLPFAKGATTFLTQANDCGGYPVVSLLGYTCANNPVGADGAPAGSHTPLYRMVNTDPRDHRYYTTASFSDAQALMAQAVRWSYEGIIGYAPKR